MAADYFESINNIVDMPISTVINFVNVIFVYYYNIIIRFKINSDDMIFNLIINPIIIPYYQIDNTLLFVLSY